MKKKKSKSIEDSLKRVDDILRVEKAQDEERMKEDTEKLISGKIKKKHA